MITFRATGHTDEVFGIGLLEPNLCLLDAGFPLKVSPSRFGAAGEDFDLAVGPPILSFVDGGPLYISTHDFLLLIAGRVIILSLDFLGANVTGRLILFACEDLADFHRRLSTWGLEAPTEAVVDEANPTPNPSGILKRAFWSVMNSLADGPPPPSEEHLARRERWDQIKRLVATLEAGNRKEASIAYRSLYGAPPVIVLSAVDQLIKSLSIPEEPFAGNPDSTSA